MKYSYALFLLLFIVIIGCSSTTSNKNLEKVTLRQEWFPNSNYAGAVFAKYEFASKYGIDIDIVQGSDQIDPVKEVMLGRSTFGDASADKVLAANEKGADLVIIGVVSYISPTCFISKEEKNIFSPKDFEGKTIGVLTGTNTEYVYRTLIKKQGLNNNKIREVEAPFDLNTFIISDDYDVRPAYVYDEPIELKLDTHNIKFRTLFPSQYGVNFIGTVYFAKRSFVDKNPQIVQAFINSIADGWKAAVKYPERAIELLKKYDNTINKDKELLKLKAGIEYYKGKDNKVLWADMSDWDDMVNYLKEYKLISSVDIKNSINNSFLLTYYAKNNH